MTNSFSPIARFLGLFAAFAFLLNFLWEAWHCAYLYQKDAGIYLPEVQGLEDFVQLITYVSVVDAMLLTGIVGVGTLIWRSRFWERITPAPGGHGREAVGIWPPVRGFSAPAPRSERGHGRKPVERFTSARLLFFVATALIVAASIEIHAVFIAHKWAYSELMPTVFGIGVSPLVQLPLTGLVALLLARRESRSTVYG